MIFLWSDDSLFERSFCHNRIETNNYVSKLFFGLNEVPFGITPDTSYFFSFSSHREAFNTLLVAAQAGEGFIKITGEVGTGKTLLCRHFLKSLGERVCYCLYSNPFLEPRTLFLSIADDLGVQLDRGTETARRRSKPLTSGYSEFAKQGKKFLYVSMRLKHCARDP